jgi:phenylpropionate dioxygenase-like ring-hydroxylating dioxygenase large terminal subunit
MLSKQDNELLTRVCGDAPMGRMLRQHWWVPALPAEKLVADGTPQRVQLFGAKYVAYRSTDGRVGFIDEACPHRGASMALARNENNSLRCIYHGWRFSIEGKTVEVPTQATREAEFCSRVPFNQYPAREAAGVVWVWLGEGAARGANPPAFPNFVINGLTGPHRRTNRQKVHANWLQAVETTMDSAHLILHSSHVAGLADMAHATHNTAPTYEVQQKPYGFRYAAIRTLDEGIYVRANSFVLPWYGVICPAESGTDAGNFFFSVPIDDEHTWYWHIPYRVDAPMPLPFMPHALDPDDWPPKVPGDESNNWGQNREAMRQGHFSGFPQSLGTEDFAVITSMGPIVDRSNEFLGSGDGALVQVRRCLLKSVHQFMDGQTPDLADHSNIDYASIRPLARRIHDGASWEDML